MRPPLLASWVGGPFISVRKGGLEMRGNDRPTFLEDLEELKLQHKFRAREQSIFWPISVRVRSGVDRAEASDRCAGTSKKKVGNQVAGPHQQQLQHHNHSSGQSTEQQRQQLQLREGNNSAAPLPDQN